MAFIETVFLEGSAGAVLDSAAGTPNSQALTIQGNASGIPVPVAGALTSTIKGITAIQGVIGSTQVGSWAVSATQGTIPWVTTATLSGTPAVTIASGTISTITNTVPVAVVSLVAGAITQGGTFAVSATQAGAFAVASTQGGSWAVSATQGTTPWVTTATITGLTAVTATISGISAVSGVLGSTQAGAFSVASTQGGSWAVSATQGTSPWVTTATITGTPTVGIVGTSTVTVAGVTGVVTAAASPAFGIATLTEYLTTAPVLTAGQSVMSQCNVAGSLLVSTEGRKPTYRAQINMTGIASLSFPSFALAGSATKTVKVTKIEITVSNTTAAVVQIIIGRTASAWVGGTSAAPSGITAMDSNNASFTAAPVAYSAIATSGGGTVSVVSVKNLVTNATTTVVASGEAVYSGVFGESGGAQPLVARGTGQVISVFSQTTAILTGFIEWTEE